MSINLDQADEDTIRLLHHKLTLFTRHKKKNMLDFMEWYPKQKEFRDKVLSRLKKETKDKKIFCILGGNRSGKTELVAGIIAEAFESIPGIQILATTVDYRMSVQVLQSKVNKLLRKNIIRYGHYNSVRGYTKDVITGTNDSKIIFRSYQGGRESIQGLDIDMVVMDEEPPYDYYMECLARTTDRDGVLLFSFTALSGFTRVVNTLFESKNPQVMTETLSLMDNPYISKEAKDNWLATIDPDEVDSRIWGKISIKTGLIYKEFKPDIHKIDRYDYDKMVRDKPDKYELHEGIDPHPRTPHHWIRFLYDMEDNVLTIVEELEAPKESMLIADFARLIKQKRQGREPIYTQIDTSAMTPSVLVKGPGEEQENIHTIRQEFTDCGIFTELCSKDNAMGIGAVKERLKQVKTPTGIVKREPLIYVFEDCTGTLWEWTRYSWDAYSSSITSERKEMINKPLKKDDHYMDIVKYECIKLKNDYQGKMEEFQEEEVLYSDMGF